MSRAWRLPLAGLAVIALGACTVGPNSSYVGPIDAPADAQVLAAGMADFMAGRLPAASTIVALDPIAPGQAGNAVTPALVTALRERGFAIANEHQAGMPGSHRLRYWVTPLDNGDLVRLTVDGTEASRFFVRNTAGTLQAAGPYMVRLSAEAAS